jgi:hypothetical protein
MSALQILQRGPGSTDRAGALVALWMRACEASTNPKRNHETATR